MADVGAEEMVITVKDDNNNILGQGKTVINTVNAVKQPATKIRILCFGDSLTSGGIWCREADRLLTEQGGTPKGKGFGNIEFCGSKKKGKTGYFGVGGWSWDSYITSGRPAFRLQVSGITSLSIGAIYEQGGKQYEIMEINVTGGTGNVLVGVKSASDAPTASGKLTKKAGSGDSEINYSSFSVDSQNPLWDYVAGKMTFVNYANTVSDGIIDIVYTLLSWNGQTPWKKDFTDVITKVKTFADTLHREFPLAKLKIMGVQIPSVRGGMGYVYGATGTSYADGYGMVVTALNQNRAYQEFANEPGYKDFVEFVNVSAQFDTEYNMPHEERAVNTRSEITEWVDNNGVHPSTNGYYQIADVVFRNVIKDNCQ